MADPVTMTLAATGLSAASGLAGAAGSLASGQSKAAGDEYQAQLAERQAQYGQIKAAQTSAYMNENLSKTLSNITAVQSATGANPDSPSGAAARNYSEFLGDRDITNQVGNINAQVSQDKSDQAFYESSANNAMLGGYLGAIGGVAGDLAGAAKSGGSGGISAPWIGNALNMGGYSPGG